MDSSLATDVDLILLSFIIIIVVAPSLLTDVKCATLNDLLSVPVETRLRGGTSHHTPLQVAKSATPEHEIKAGLGYSRLVEVVVIYTLLAVGTLCEELKFAFVVEATL